MGVQVSCGLPPIKENCFIFHVFPYELFIWIGTKAHFRIPTFQLLAKHLWWSESWWERISLHLTGNPAREESSYTSQPGISSGDMSFILNLAMPATWSGPIQILCNWLFCYLMKSPNWWRSICLSCVCFIMWLFCKEKLQCDHSHIVKVLSQVSRL